MTNPLEHRIRHRAHQLWVDDGQPDGRALDYWLKAQSEVEGEAKSQSQSQSRRKNEGEGSQTAARAYNSKAAKFAQSGQVDAKAKEARDAIDGPEGLELKRAERIGKRRSRGEDPHGPGA